MNLKIEADIRNKGKKSDLNKLRNNNLIPAIIYGEGLEGKKISLSKISFMKKYKKSIGETTFFDISVDGNSYTTVIKEKQIHPVTREIVHIDFLEMHKGKPITLEVPLKYVGEPIGVKAGALLEILMHKIEATCLPKDIPDDIEIDISSLDVGHSIHLKDIDVGKLEIKLPVDITLATVKAKKGTKTDEEEEEEIESTESQV